MISYNPKEWFTFIFRLHKADTFRKLSPLMLGIGAYSALVGYLELSFWKVSAHDYISHLSVMHTLLGFAISMLLVFRTNTAYDRWWEGRKLWGSLVNNSRNLAIKMAAFLPPEDEQLMFFRKTIPAYAAALHKHLRREEIRIELFDETGQHRHIFDKVDRAKHVPNQLALLMMQHVQQLYAGGKLTGDQLILLNSELLSFTDICGACERIKNTPIPYSHSAFIKKFMFIYIMTLPFGYAFTLGYIIVPVVMFIFYVLASLEIIAEEIEDPFSGDANDVPTDKLAETIKRSVEELI